MKNSMLMAELTSIETDVQIQLALMNICEDTHFEPFELMERIEEVGGLSAMSGVEPSDSLINQLISMESLIPNTLNLFTKGRELAFSM